MSAEATLLAIDDEPDVLVVIERFAQRMAFNVVSRTDARAALDELHVLKGRRTSVPPHAPPACRASST